MEMISNSPWTSMMQMLIRKRLVYRTGRKHRGRLVVHQLRGWNHIEREHDTNRLWTTCIGCERLLAAQDGPACADCNHAWATLKRVERRARKQRAGRPA